MEGYGGKGIFRICIRKSIREEGQILCTVYTLSRCGFTNHHVFVARDRNLKGICYSNSNMDLKQTNPTMQEFSLQEPQQPTKEMKKVIRPETTKLKRYSHHMANNSPTTMTKVLMIT